jgi:tRNA-splicing ligase RtcB
MTEVTGLIAFGFNPGAWFKDALTEANRLAAEGASQAEIISAISRHEAALS